MLQSQQLHISPSAQSNSVPFMFGAVGTVDSYRSALFRVPMVSPEEQRELFNRLRRGDETAAERLVLAHLRLVASIARTYFPSGVPQADLIQEGSVGLINAIAGFDPDHGVNFASYALPYVKSAIMDFVVRNERIVRRVTTKTHRKLYFNLHRYTREGASLRQEQIVQVCEDLDVEEEDVRDMQVRLRGMDVPMDLPTGHDGAGPSPCEVLCNEDDDPATLIETEDLVSKRRSVVAAAMDSLDARSRRIVELRWMCEEDEDKPTLGDLAKEYGVTTQRMQQIEAAALRKIKTFLSELH